MPFISGPDGDLKTAFVSDAWLIERFVGNTLFGWGAGTSGELGDNTAASKSSPIQTIALGINWEQTSAGTGFSAAVKTDGTLWCWGVNTNGRLGDNTATSRSSPVQTVTFATNWKQVACGDNHTAAVKTDGTLWLWGNNSNGHLGDNTTTSRSSPVQTIARENNWSQVSCSNVTTNGHTAAIKTDGTLWTWGINGNGQLGDNTRTSRSSPVQTIAFGTSWKQVDCGNSFVAAIKTDGTLWCWGLGTSGQLGDNTVTSKSSPVQTVAGGTNWKQVSCGGTHMAAIKTDGTLWSWGDGALGRLGDNTITSKSSPVQTIAYGTNWKQVSCGVGHTAAIKNDGTLWSWGIGTGGRLGDNTAASKSSPVQTIAYGINWKQVSGGGVHTTAVTYADI